MIYFFAIVLNLLDLLVCQCDDNSISDCDFSLVLLLLSKSALLYCRAIFLLLLSTAAVVDACVEHVACCVGDSTLFAAANPA